MYFEPAFSFFVGVLSCPQKMVIGAAGQMVAQIAREAGEDLSRVFLREVRLKLTAKLRK